MFGLNTLDTPKQGEAVFVFDGRRGGEEEEGGGFTEAAREGCISVPIPAGCVERARTPSLEDGERVLFCKKEERHCTRSR